MSTVIRRMPVRTRSAWKPADFAAPDAFSFTLTAAHFAAFDAALAANRHALSKVFFRGKDGKVRKELHRMETSECEDGFCVMK